MKWLHGYLMIYSAAPRSLWPEHCVPALENQVPVTTMALSRDRTASEPHKGSGFTPFFTSGTMPTTVKISWMFIRMSHEWESCLRSLIYFLIHGLGLTVWTSFICGVVCFSWCQLSVMLVPLLGWSADTSSSLRSARAPLGRANLSYPLCTLLLWQVSIIFVHLQAYLPCYTWGGMMYWFRGSCFMPNSQFHSTTIC